MTILKKLLSHLIESPEARLNELYLYELVAEEISRGNVIKWLFAKALMESSGNEEAARGRYIKLRVQMLKDQVDIELRKSRDRLVTEASGAEVKRLNSPKKKRKRAVKKKPSKGAVNLFARKSKKKIVKKKTVKKKVTKKKRVSR